MHSTSLKQNERANEVKSWTFNVLKALYQLQLGQLCNARSNCSQRNLHAGVFTETSLWYSRGKSALLTSLQSSSVQKNFHSLENIKIAREVFAIEWKAQAKIKTWKHIGSSHNAHLKAKLLRFRMEAVMHVLMWPMQQQPGTVEARPTPTNKRVCFELLSKIRLRETRRWWLG